MSFSRPYATAFAGATMRRSSATRRNSGVYRNEGGDEHDGAKRAPICSISSLAHGSTRRRPKSERPR
jgi:hypothetical protein